jgi:hypothetical protein
VIVRLVFALVIAAPGCQRPGGDTVDVSALAEASSGRVPDGALAPQAVVTAFAAPSATTFATATAGESSASASPSVLHRRESPLGGRGSRCAPGSCGPGLACCDTGFRGHCGGAHMPEEQEAPCIVTRTCEPPPCSPMSFPP